MGLENETPQGINTETLPARVKAMRSEKKLRLGGERDIAFDPQVHLLMLKDQTLPQHPNGMRFTAFGANGDVVGTREYFSIGASPAARAPRTRPHASQAAAKLNQPRALGSLHETVGVVG